MSGGHGSPLELVRYNTQTGKFEVGQAALKALRQVKTPLGVVAVCGRARQGKSFILNQLLSTTTGGFVVGPTHRPCTKGLWMWSNPVKRTAPDGSEHHLVSRGGDEAACCVWQQHARIPRLQGPQQPYVPKQSPTCSRSI